MDNYSTEILELIIKGEEITEENMSIIRRNKELKEIQKELTITVNLYKELQKKELELLSKIGKELERSQKRLRDHRRQLRILKIKKINLKKKKLRLTGYVNL